MPNTTDQEVAESIGRAIDGRIFRLQDERAKLLQAAARIVAIDAELAGLAAEKVRIDLRRPPVPAPVVLPIGAVIAEPVRVR